MKKTRKFIALFLSVVISLHCFAVISFAETTENEFVDISSGAEETAEEWYVADEQEVITDDLIGEVAEITSMREENEKHFRLSDGTYEAVVYSQPIHRKDKDGIWQDIDNTIELKSDSNVSKYVTQDSRVSFANKFEVGSDLFVLSENGYSISMSLLNGGNGLGDELGTTDFGAFDTPTVNNSAAKRMATVFNSLEEAKNINNKSSIVYNNIRENTNLEYVLSGNDVKENIIINAPCESYEYIFQITLDGLYAELDGNVIFIKDVETNQTKYTVPAPYMYDAEGNYSYDVSYELERVKDELYLLVIIADEEWINSEGRTFPVVVDPTVTTSFFAADSYINSAAVNANYGSATDLWVSTTCTAFIYLPLPAMPSGATLNNAYLYVPYYYHITTGSLRTGAYKVTSNWAENTIKYSNAPQLNEADAQSYKNLEASTSITASTPGSVKYSIIKAAREWFQGSAPNYGIAIKREESTTATNQSVILKSGEASCEEPTYISVNYSYTLAEGVYAFESVWVVNAWITVENDSCFAGSKLQYEISSVDPTASNVFDRSRLFKVTRVGNYERYTIRSMLNNNLSFNIVGDKIVTKEIPSIDVDVPLADTFSIYWNGEGFMIEPYNSSNIISIPSSSSSDLSFEPDSSESLSTRWIFKQYTGVHTYGSTIFYPSILNAGTTVTITPVIWSTRTGYNIPKLSVASEYTDKATSTWDASTYKGLFTLHDDGIFAVISELYNGDQELLGTICHTLTITLVVDEGIYFIKNKEVSKYMQIDDDDDPNYNTSGIHMELWDFDGGDYQKWQLVHLGDGYYKILSDKSGMALCVPNGSTNEDEVALVQESYSNLSRKKWKITKSSSGAYVFRPKTSEGYSTDWCMCAGDQFLGITDGLNVEQKAYVNDSGYKDEWILEALDSYKITFYGISNFGHDHSSCLETVKNNLHDATFNNVTLKTGAISSSDCLTDLKNTSVFTSRSHGQVIVWSGKTTAASTGIILNDEEGLGMVALYSHSWSNMTSGSRSVATTDSFTGLNLVLFIGCETAYDGVNGRNLPAIVSSKGAEVAIGFSESINCSDANKWTIDFYTYLLEGHTVQESVDYASGNRSTASGLKSAVVCGNGNYRISE